LYSSRNKINDEIVGPAFNSLYKSKLVYLLISSDLVCFDRVHFCDVLPVVKQHVNYYLVYFLMLFRSYYNPDMFRFYKTIFRGASY
jgi:hypothetical protein